MSLDNVKDELYDLKQFGTFQSNAVGNSKPLSSGQSNGGDDWTDAETENDSNAEFGGAEFGGTLFESQEEENGADEPTLATESSATK